LKDVGLVRDRWFWAAIAAFLFFALGARAKEASPLRIGAAGDGSASPAALGADPCPNGTAPDGNVCVHLEAPDEGTSGEARTNAHHERSGRLTTYEQIPRLPDRPSDYDAYRYPIPPGLPGGHYVVSGYDLDKPDEQQRRGPTLRHVGHGAVDLPQTKGTPVALVALEHQDGDAEVLYAGALFGLTVVTRHTLRESGRLREYVVLFGHLDTIAPGISAGVTLKDGELVGTVGDTGSPRLVHLHLEIRRVRDGIELARVPAGAMLIADSVSIVCDPRNVLPLK
jgi:murein DD-endopeptidase MepM/ murein hydrolase activator NlpD